MATKKKDGKSAKANAPFSIALRAKGAAKFETIYDMAFGACSPLVNALEMAKAKAAEYEGVDRDYANRVSGKLSTIVMSLGEVLGALKIADEAMGV